MPQVINTNFSSLNAQRNLNTSQSSLATSLQRLSSGLRLNSAKDDAAGVAIAERFTSQIRGLNQAVRNASDGISLAQTTEGAISEVVNNLQRIRELAVQSANATNSASDRAALNQEVQQRLQEIDRIASQTNFNGRRVLDGTFGTSNFQVGANVGDTVSVNLSQGVKSTQLGQIATSTGNEVGLTALSGTSTIQVGSNAAVTIGASVAGTGSGQTAASAYAKAVAINGSGVAGLTATATNNVELVIADTAGTSATDTYSLAINSTDIFNAYDQATNGVLTSSQIADAINAQTSNTGVTATLSGTNLRLTAADGRDINIGQTLGAGATGGITAGTGGSSTVNGVVYRDGTIGTFTEGQGTSPDATSINGGTLTLTASENIVITGDGDDMGFAAANTTIAKDTTTLSTGNVSTVSASNDLISRIDSALTDVNSIRADLGSVQNRFESIVVSLQTASENLSASRSRIQDADFAAETANLTRAQILQQAGITVLAQANSNPQNVLALLQ